MTVNVNTYFDILNLMADSSVVSDISEQIATSIFRTEEFFYQTTWRQILYCSSINRMRFMIKLKEQLSPEMSLHTHQIKFPYLHHKIILRIFSFI
jgi:hypothetical protein